MRREADGWRCLTPSWPEGAYVIGLAIQGKVAILATRRHGVGLCDLGDGALRSVALGPR